MQGTPCCAWFPLHPFLSAFSPARRQKAPVGASMRGIPFAGGPSSRCCRHAATASRGKAASHSPARLRRRSRFSSARPSRQRGSKRACGPRARVPSGSGAFSEPGFAPSLEAHRSGRPAFPCGHLRQLPRHRRRCVVARPTRFCAQPSCLSMRVAIHLRITQPGSNIPNPLEVEAPSPRSPSGPCSFMRPLAPRPGVAAALERTRQTWIAGRARRPSPREA